MGLSDEERRRLDEIERSLQSEGEGFRAGLGRRMVILFARAGEVDDARQRRRVAACAVMGVGLVVLLTGLMLTQGSAAVGLMVAVVGLVFMTGGLATSASTEASVPSRAWLIRMWSISSCWPSKIRENRCSAGSFGARVHNRQASPWSGWSNPPVSNCDPGGRTAVE